MYGKTLSANLRLRENMSYKNSLSKKSTQVHLFRFESLLRVEYKRVMKSRGGCTLL